jgi:hypothetical protein
VVLNSGGKNKKTRKQKNKRKIPKIVATFVYASSQGQRTHSAQTNIQTIPIQNLSKPIKTNQSRTSSNQPIPNYWKLTSTLNIGSSGLHALHATKCLLLMAFFLFLPLFSAWVAFLQEGVSLKYSNLSKHIQKHPIITQIQINRNLSKHYQPY